MLEGRDSLTDKNGRRRIKADRRVVEDETGGGVDGNCARLGGGIGDLTSMKL